MYHLRYIGGIKKKNSNLNISDGLKTWLYFASKYYRTCISTDTFPTSKNQSRGQLSSVSDEIIKLIPSVLNELAKVGKENVLQKFFSHV